MTLGDMKFLVSAHLQTGPVWLNMDGLKIIRFINEALQYMYAKSLALNPVHFVRRVAFTAGSNPTVDPVNPSVLFPADYKDTVYVDMPSAAGSAAAERISHRDWVRIQGHSWLAPTSSYPKFMVTLGGFVLLPGGSGTHYYYFNILDLTTETQDLSAYGGASLAVIPWQVEEAVFLKTVQLAIMSDAQDPELPVSEVKKRIDEAEALEKKIETALLPVPVTEAETQRPV